MAALAMAALAAGGCDFYAVFFIVPSFSVQHHRPRPTDRSVMVAHDELSPRTGGQAVLVPEQEGAPMSSRILMAALAAAALAAAGCDFYAVLIINHIINFALLIFK